MEKKTAPSFWKLSIPEALSFTNSTEQGISQTAAEQRITTFGPNSLKEKINTKSLLLFVRQFKTPVTLLLIGAAILSMLLGDGIDSSIIFCIIIISSFLGFWQEKGAADALA